MTYTIEIKDIGIVIHKITLSDTQSDTQIAQKKCKKYGITSDHIKKQYRFKSLDSIVFQGFN